LKQLYVLCPLLVIRSLSLELSPLTKICDTVDDLLKDRISASLIKTLNPSFSAPSRPFLRLSYSDAVAWLNEHNIQHPEEDSEGNPIKDADGQVKMVEHALGDDIAEAAERRMTDIIGKPVFLYGFPAELKAFYMKRIAPKEGDDQKMVFTESCDLLMPGVGEIIGKFRLSFLPSCKPLTFRART
jgi:asparaginyl-tRNA synthetase